MILPDVNLLIYAYNLDSRYHERARTWLSEALSGTELVALPWVVLFGFLRMTTNRAIVSNPLSAEEAVNRLEEWLQLPNVRILSPTHRHAEILAGFLRRIGTAGNLTTDAHLAALAIEHGCALYSTDADFGRFPGLTWRNPLT